MVQNFHTFRTFRSGRTSLVLLFSSLRVTYSVRMGFDFIVIVPLLHSRCGFFFIFGRGVSFSGRFQHPSGSSLVAQLVKSLPAIWEAQFQSLGWEDPLEKEIATHSSILAWTSRDRGAWWATVHGVTKSQT